MRRAIFYVLIFLIVLVGSLWVLGKHIRMMDVLQEQIDETNREWGQP